MEKKFLTLNDIFAYKRALKLSNYLWEIVIIWNIFQKNTVGQQFVRAIDSISANIAEGFGRWSKKDKIRFYRYASGSVKECLDWNEKSKARKLITQEQYNFILEELLEITILINELIKYTNYKLKI